MNVRSSDVIDFQAVRETAKIRMILRRFRNHGLEEEDITMIARAAHRAFSQDYTLPPVDDFNEQAYASLSRLNISKFTHQHVGTAYVIFRKPHETFYYFVADDPISPSTLAVGAQAWDLSTTESPRSALWMVDTIGNLIESQGFDTVNLFGLFALDMFFFAGQGRFQVLNFLHMHQTDRVAALLYDPVRKKHIAMFSELKNWLPTPDERAGKPKQPAVLVTDLI